MFYGGMSFTVLFNCSCEFIIYYQLECWDWSIETSISQEMLVGGLVDNSNFKLGMVSGQRGRKEEYHFGLILGLHPLCLQEEQFAS